MSLKHWENYYRGGALATCPTSPSGGFDQELLAAWTEFFDPLPDEASVLDIGTGNGVVLLLAAERSQRLKRQWKLHGTDLAQIDPVRDVPAAADRLALCHFHPGVATEHLPFDDASFDAVSGHYALEYAQPEAALGEIARVLKVGGRAQFILHHAQSRLVANARQSLSEAEQVIHHSRIHRHLKRLLSLPDHAASVEGRETLALRQAIHQLRAVHAEAIQRGGGRVLAVTLDAVRQLLEARPEIGAARAQIEVERAEADLRQSVRRLRDLLERAQDQTKMDALVAQAERTGLRLVELAPQHHAGVNLVGWRLRLESR